MSISAITTGDDAIGAAVRSARDVTNRNGQVAQPGSSGVAEELSRLAEKLSQLNQTSIQISKHPGTGAVIVRVIDRNTGQVVREAPPEEVLDCVSHLLAQSGLLLDRSA